MSQTDFEVIRQVLAGDTEAFETLVRRYQQAIFRLTYRMTRNVEDARDLAQEAFVQAYRSLGSFQRRSSFSTWLYRIAMNVSLNRLKAAGREVPAEADAQVPDDREDSLARVLRDERNRAVAAAIADLPPQQQATLTLPGASGAQPSRDRRGARVCGRDGQGQLFPCRARAAAQAGRLSGHAGGRTSAAAGRGVASRPARRSPDWG